MAFATLVGASVAAAKERVIEYEDDTLTVRLSEAPLAEVIAEIGRQSGARISGPVRETLAVSAAFDRVPFDEALGRLLRDQSFTLRFSKDGTLQVVELCGGRQGAGSDTAAPAPSPGALLPPVEPMQTATPPPSPRALFPPAKLMQAVAHYPPVPVSGHAATRFGTPQADLTAVMGAAIYDRDPRVRWDALQAGLAAMDGDPTLRSAVIEALGGLSNRALARSVQNVPDDLGEDFLAHVATGAQDEVLRTKAYRALRALHRLGHP